jgi:hypothetical protein
MSHESYLSNSDQHAERRQSANKRKQDWTIHLDIDQQRERKS